MTKGKVIVPLESEEQIALVKCSALREWGAYFFHIPNERWDKMEAIRGKQQGVKRGIPDNWLIMPRLNLTEEPAHLDNAGVFVGAIMELKRRNAPPSSVKPEQWDWLTHLADCGFMVFVCRGAEEGIRAFDAYWKGGYQAYQNLGMHITRRYGTIEGGLAIPSEWKVEL